MRLKGGHMDDNTIVGIIIGVMMGVFSKLICNYIEVNS